MTSEICLHNVPKNDCITCFQKSLPIYSYKELILNEIEKCQFIIVQAETGSGKSTQLPQYLMQAGYKGIICTQPRRIAAISLASRVAKEVNCTIGTTVGYKVRFEELISDETVITYASDGSLCRELMHNPTAKGYSVVIIDEVHERTVSTDILCALVKKICHENRNDLKVIITSATLDTEKFSTYFNDANVIKVPGKMYPVDVTYISESTLEATIYNIHTKEPSGDILVFLPGQKEILKLIQSLNQLFSPNSVVILPLYASLPLDEQGKIFQPTPTGKRKIICSTNVAETSITIEGIVYVVDTGIRRVLTFNHKSRIEILAESYISKQDSEQRKGRAGRMQPGKCYRLYSKEQYNQLEQYNVPDIVRGNFVNYLINLKALGINDISSIDFIDSPLKDAVSANEIQLKELGILDSSGNLTDEGKLTSNIAISPELRKALIDANQFKCLKPVIIIVSMMSATHRLSRTAQNVLFTSKYVDETGDHLTMYNIFNGWLESGMSDDWCMDNLINSSFMNQAYKISEQIKDILAQYNFDVESCKVENVLRSFVGSSTANVAEKINDQGDFNNGKTNKYSTIDGALTVYLYQSSPLNEKGPELVVFHKILHQYKPYMVNASKIDRILLTSSAFLKLKQINQNTNVVSFKPAWMKK